MSYQERKRLISELEKVRSSRALCYILSDRETFPPGIPGFSTNLASEPHLLFIDQLRAIGKTKQLDLFLYTRGGAIDSVWPLVSLMREYSDKLTVVVPFKSHSGGTLICLGANEVTMTEFAELSPIDPTTGNQFNPSDPTNPQNKFAISVEDVAAYFEFSEELADIKQEPYKLEVMKELTKSVHPLALGNVQRVYMQIRELARKLLALHMDEETNATKIKEIIQALTEKFYSHLHAINRREAISLLGDWVKEPTKEEELIIWQLFNSYTETLQLRSKFSLPAHMKDEPACELNTIGAFLESTELSFIYTTNLKVAQRPLLPPNVQIQLPPGGSIPLQPWVTRTFDYGIIRLGWSLNEKEV